MKDLYNVLWHICGCSTSAKERKGFISSKLGMKLHAPQGVRILSDKSNKMSASRKSPLWYNAIGVTFNGITLVEESRKAMALRI